MSKRILLVLFAFLLFDSRRADAYGGISFQKLENGVSVVFIDTVKSNSLLVVLCVSSGSADELDKEGVANLLTYIFMEKLQANANADTLQHGSEINSYTEHDQSLYYFYGNLESLESFLKNLGTVFTKFSFSENDLRNNKRKIEEKLLMDNQIDKILVKKESRKSVYWHSRYGADISGNLDSLKNISERDILNFKNKNYTNNRATLIIAGDIKKDEAAAMIIKYFGKGEQKSVIDRLQEPPHHRSTTKIMKSSQQVGVPIVEFYWKIPNYRTEKMKALSVEIFVNYLEETLKKILVDEQKVAALISYYYSFWNYDSGVFSITATLRNSNCIEESINAILSEIKYIAFEGITKEQADDSVKRIVSSSKKSMFFQKAIFNEKTLDIIEWISRRIGSGNEFDFIKGYPDFVKKYDLEDVNVQAKAIFKNDPCVISVIKPVEIKNAG
ncbi:MAG: insulinase family protein [Holosporaceae bacterium]|jgi:predicted Zn-dependent peptidase|nr:insulinase family protein [Holosporaceae bacterium]